jgi:hypothetical protein
MALEVKSLCSEAEGYLELQSKGNAKLLSQYLRKYLI